MKKSIVVAAIALFISGMANADLPARQETLRQATRDMEIQQKIDNTIQNHQDKQRQDDWWYGLEPVVKPYIRVTLQR